MGRRTEWTLSKEELQMTNRHMIRYTTLLTIREMQIKIIIRYGLKPVRITIIKKTQINAGEDVEKRDFSYTVGEKGLLLHCCGSINWCSHCVKQ